ERGLSGELENNYERLARSDVVNLAGGFGSSPDLVRLQQGIGHWHWNRQCRRWWRHHQSRRIRIVNRQGSHVRPDVASRNANGNRGSQRGRRSAREKNQTDL